ncbi:MAG: acyl-CoA thioesterase [Gemmataceae bacterium]|nr:acyl-CoA thioesterase [Gemmataceae bacterium]
MKRRVAFSETDMAGIVHFSVFFRWMEDAEHEWLRARGLSVSTVWEGEEVSFPRVAATCDYLKPARFEDEVDIEAQVERIGTKSIRWAFDVKRGGELLARGSITAVMCKVGERKMEPMAIPEALREKLK